MPIFAFITIHKKYSNKLLIIQFFNRELKNHMMDGPELSMIFMIAGAICGIGALVGIKVYILFRK